MGACTFAITGHDVHNNKAIVKGTLTFSASYATGGDSFSPRGLAGMSEVTSVLVEGNEQGASVQLGAASTATAPAFELYTGDGTEASNASDNSTIAVPVWLFGTL
jgi:hypothetical protein